jgi:hypothetical protein
VLWSSLGLILWIGALSAQAVGAQDTQENPVQTHVGHVADAFTGTPEGQGLLPTARAEAEIAVRHLGLASGDVANLDAIKLHVGHAQHAIDPTVVTSGPGLGYGVKQAAEGVASHMRLVYDTESASARVKMYARHVGGSAETVVERTAEFARLSQQIRDATSAADAAGVLEDLTELGNQIIQGRDANNDNGIGARRGEGGLEQARQALVVLKAAAAQGGGRGRGAAPPM